MSGADLHLPQFRPLGRTMRTDAWWVQPVLVVFALTTFLVYANWAAWQGANYFYHAADGAGYRAHYLSPFYSPLIYGQADEPRWIGADRPSWWPSWAPFSAAILILAGPAGMRFTCYYYRGAYYKAFWADPPSCAVGEPAFRRERYRGERKFPLVMQNIHRFFFYPAAIFVLILLYDGVRAFFFTGPDGRTHFGVGVGSIVLLLNAILLGGYTFGCHCSRHLIGGLFDRISEHPVRKACYDCVSALNRRHMSWAWVSLVWVGWSDVYVRMLCTGVIRDWHVVL